jgi:hypothetical protein
MVFIPIEYSEGVRAAMCGDLRESNPYKKESVCYLWWDYGWCDIDETEDEGDEENE